MLHKIKENIWFTECSPETDRPNLGYVKGTDAAVMVDSGNSPAQVKEYLNAVKKAGLPEPKYVFLLTCKWQPNILHSRVPNCITTGMAQNGPMQKTLY